MKRTKFSTLLLAAALFTGMGATSAFAGMGEKCGGAVKQPAQGKCGAKQDGKCGDGKAMKPGKCGAADTKKPEPGKCGGEKKAPAMKCGAGKCGS